MNTYIQNKLDEFDVRFELQSQGCMECYGDYLIDLIKEKQNEENTKRHINPYYSENDLNSVKDFIKQSLTDYHNHIVEKIDGQTIIATDDTQFGLHTDGYNNAIEDILSLLQDTNQKE